MPKSFTIEAKTYIIKHINKDLYLDMFGFMSKYGDLTARFDTKKQAQIAYRNGKSAACSIIINEKERHTYESVR